MNTDERISNFVKLKERLTGVNHIFLHQAEPQFSDVDWDIATEEFFLLKTQIEEVLKTLPTDELDRIVLKDFEACVGRKTAEPLLWMCGIDFSETPIHIDIGMDYSPDVLIGLRMCPDEEGKDVLCFSYRTYGITESLSFTLFDMEEKLRYTLDRVEYYSEPCLGEDDEPTDEELEDEELE